MALPIGPAARPQSRLGVAPRRGRTGRLGRAPSRHRKPVLRLDDETLADPDLRRGGSGSRSWQAWFPPEEVPADLRSRRVEIEARVVLDVDRSGRPTSCRMLRPSGERRLDEIVCPRFMERSQLPLYYERPGVPAPARTVMSVTWRTAPPAPDFAPPPLPLEDGGPGPWPRLAWDGMLALIHLPDVQAHYPAEAGGAEGFVGLDLVVSSAEGVTDCIVGMSSGTAALDAAACRAAAALPMRYVERCDACRTTRVPIQLVWRPAGSYARFPLPAHMTVPAPRLRRPIPMTGAARAHTASARFGPTSLRPSSCRSSARLPATPAGVRRTFARATL